ncbi:MAG TPA: carbohydrate porin [Burkholderiales bacterium]|nr:carbohydrate porin [Burkholderiales bacterium]
MPWERILLAFLLLACAGSACAAPPPGVTLGLRYTGEVIGNVSGGISRGAAYEGLAELDLDADLDALLDWHAAKLHASAYQIHGHGPSANYVGNIMDVSNIEARPTTRLYALWLQQGLPWHGASLRAGQLGADEEFLLSRTAAGLINGTFGWAALAAADQAEGGPAYPLATPGARLRFAPRPDRVFLLAAFAGHPAGRRCAASPQRCDLHGTTFSVSGGTLWMSELQLSGAYKLGGWYQTGSFPDQNDSAAAHRDDWGLYAIADRTLWRARSVSAFARLGGAPADRNLISLYLDAGLGFAGPIAARPQDRLTVGAACTGFPLSDHESVLELSYVARLTRRWSLQPDLQYVFNPGNNAPDPSDPSHSVRDALVIGLRAVFRL